MIFHPEPKFLSQKSKKNLKQIQKGKSNKQKYEKMYVMFLTQKETLRQLTLSSLVIK